MTLSRAAATTAAVLFGACATANEGATTPPGSAVDVAVPGVTKKLRMIATAPSNADAPALLFSDAEITWDFYEVFAFSLDVAPGTPAGADGVARPSKPYFPPDKGYGREGFPAIGMSLHGARTFCEWLSRRTGRTFRLPTEAEWEAACRAGAGTAYAFGDDPAGLDAVAWFGANADDKPHPARGKTPNAWGLFDMHGNVGEWCETSDGAGVLKGGHFQSDVAGLRCDARETQTRAWNRTDPQIPKSRWWLQDAPFVGFRVVCVL